MHAAVFGLLALGVLVFSVGMIARRNNPSNSKQPHPADTHRDEQVSSKKSDVDPRELAGMGVGQGNTSTRSNRDMLSHGT